MAIGEREGTRSVMPRRRPVEPLGDCMPNAKWASFTLRASSSKIRAGRGAGQSELGFPAVGEPGASEAVGVVVVEPGTVHGLFGAASVGVHTHGAVHGDAAGGAHALAGLACIEQGLIETAPKVGGATKARGHPVAGRR